jgi:hypothetical protein
MRMLYGGGVYGILGHAYVNFDIRKTLAPFWGSIYLFRKGGLIAISVFTEGVSSDLQVFLGLFWISAFMVLTAYVKPYRKRSKMGTHLDLLSMMSIALTAVVAKVDELTASGQRKCDISGSWSGAVIIVVHTFVFITFAYFAILTMVRKLHGTSLDAVINMQRWGTFSQRLLVRDVLAMHLDENFGIQTARASFFGGITESVDRTSGRLFRRMKTMKMSPLVGTPGASLKSEDSASSNGHNTQIRTTSRQEEDLPAPPPRFLNSGQHEPTQSSDVMEVDV